MEPDRVHAYLQAACSGLGFDIGEVWFCSKKNKTSSVAAIGSRNENEDNRSAHQKEVKFLQLYTSKSYNNRRKDLLRPSSENDEINDDSDDINKHVLSPRIVDAISRSAQIVWAHCQERGGLLGRSDMLLQTAVGMPVATDAEGNMAIVVMFSPKNIQNNTDAMEYLRLIAQSAMSSNIPCLLPVVDTNKSKLVYNPQKFIDWQHSKPTSDLMAVSNDDFVTDAYGIPILPQMAEIKVGTCTSPTDDDAASAFDEATYGVWSTIMNIPLEEEDDMHLLDPRYSQEISLYKNNLHPECKERLEEFSTAFLGLSVFDAADIWVPNNEAESGSSTFVLNVSSIISTNKNQGLCRFREQSVKTSIKSWSGAVGTAFSSQNIVWSSRQEVIIDPERSAAFKDASIKTAFAIPIVSTGATNPSCILCFYSMMITPPVPFVIKFVYKALRSLWLGLENVKPDNNVKHNIWKDVGPADLGEMAADIEMQRAFYRKRPYDEMVVSSENTNTMQHSTKTKSNSEPSYHSQTEPRIQLVRTVNIALLDSSSTKLSTALSSDENVSDTLQQTHQKVKLFSHVNIPSTEASTNMITPQSSLRNDDNDRIVQNDIIHTTDNLQFNMTQNFPQETVQSFGDMKISIIDPIETETVPSSSHQTIRDTVGATSNIPPVQFIGGIDIPLMGPRTDGSYNPNNYPPHTNIHPPSMNTEPTYLKNVGESNYSPYHSQQPVGTLDNIQPLQHAGNRSFDQPILKRPCNYEIPMTQNTAVPLLLYPGMQKPSSSNFPTSSTTSKNSNLNYVHMNSYREHPDVARANIDTFNQLVQSHLNQQSMTPTTSQSHNPPHVHMPQSNPSVFSSPSDNTQTIIPEHQSPVSPPLYCSPITTNFINIPSNTNDDNNICRVDGCNEITSFNRPYCNNHSGTRMCEKPGCQKCAQGSTKFCISHGGGRRCTYPGCDRGARDKLFCAGHGGGKRCTSDGCTKSAVGGSGFCTAHGGGRRCTVDGCEKSAQSSTLYCVKHGGGKKCNFIGCTRVARGKTKFCAAHGGGIRCKLDGCNRIAVGRLQLCRCHGGGAKNIQSFNK